MAALSPALRGSVASVILRNNNAPAIGVKKNFGRVESHPIGGFKWSVCPIPVELSGLYAWYEDMPVMVGTAGPWIYFNERVPVFWSYS